MKSVKVNILLFIAFVIMGFLVVTNIDMELLPNVFKLKSMEYKNIAEERNRLYKEVERLEEENIGYEKKINDYKDNDGRSDKIVNDMRLQVKDYSMLSGADAVKGPGIIIKIEDGEINTKVDTPFEVWRKILHDNDMALVLNELKNAGAEAVAINNHRILNCTGVICRWAFIGFENKTMEYAPFYIYVIGDPEQMKTTLLAEGSHIQDLILRSLKVDISISNELIIPITKQNITPKYMQRYFAEEKAENNKGK